MDRRGVPCAPINTFGDVLADAHIAEMGIIHPLQLPNGVETKTTGFPVRMSCFDYAVLRPPPGLGEHEADVLEDWLGETGAGGKETT